MTEGQLTWHAGSVLPYASLWHTVLRAVHLNALRTRELPFSASGEWDRPHAIDLLFNEASIYGQPSVCVPAFAQALGEPIEAFDWSHLGSLPQSLRCILLPTARICPECIALGYHSALYSLKPLPVCPIHHCAFLERCTCGRPFSCVMKSNQLWDAALGCPCGETHFFARETCRRPALDRAQTRPLQALARWLDRMATVSLPRPTSKDARQVHSELFEDGLATWCRELGIHYPADLAGRDDPTIPAFRCAWTSLDAVPATPARHASPLKTPPASSSVWRDTPECSVYRAFERHLRRHVTRHCAAITAEFLALPDPLSMAQKMKSSAQAQVAFAELLFMGGMEPWAYARRWPNRGTRQNPEDQDRDRHRDIGSAEIDDSRAHQQGLSERSPWLIAQVAAARVLFAWSRAQLLAVLCTRQGIADWTSIGYTYRGTWFSVPPPEQVSWAAAVVGDRQLKVAFWPAVSCFDWTLPLPDKSRRRHDWAMALAQRRAALDEACGGPCLTWSVAQGWRVQPAAHPRDGEVPKRHKLLGAGVTASCWLFYCCGQYAARACDLPLQALGESPREAFDALRRAYRQYRQRYGVPAEGTRSQAQAKVVPPPPTRAEEAFRLQLQTMSRQGKFWRNPQEFVHPARERCGLSGYYAPQPNLVWRPLRRSSPR
jgi:hypothetical protein